MKKLMTLIMLAMVLTSSANANMKTKFIDDLIKMTKGKADDVIRHLPKSRNPKMLKESIENIKIPKLKKAIQKVPEKAILVNRTEKIIKKGKFEEKFFANQNFDNQLAMIVQDAKYGDKYFIVAKKVSNISSDVVLNNPYLAKQITKRSLNSKTLQKKFVETLEKTGKYGWEKLQEIGSWVAKHPKISTASGAYAWYVLDPNGFEEQLKNSGKTLTEFLMTTVGSVSSGVAEKITEEVEEAIDNIKQDMDRFMDDKVNDIKASSSYIVTWIVGIFTFILLFVVWRKRRIIRHFITKSDKVEENMNHKIFEKEDDEF